jgi:hypothetical protein
MGTLTILILVAVATVAIPAFVEAAAATGIFDAWGRTGAA